MAEVTHYDAIIIGSGQAANPLAQALSAKGKRTALIERAVVGGTCRNYGCTPTKTMVASAETAYMARRAGEYGVRVGKVAVDMPAVRERKRGVVKQWRERGEKRLKEAKLVELIYGEAHFASPKEISVQLKSGGERRLAADLIVIDTGLSAAVPPLAGLKNVPYLDNVTVMELGEIPEHLLVLGGGYIGLEFAQMFRRFGSRVTVIQREKQLLTAEDADVAEEIEKLLREDGIEILLGAKAESVAASGKDLLLTVRTVPGKGASGTDATAKTLKGTHLLVATGRRPNTHELDLAAAGIATDERGYIRVNDRLETAVPGVYAAGDVKGGPAFTHISYDDYRVLKANLLDGENRSIAGRMVPYCVFIDPQLGRIGLSEKQASEQGTQVRVARMPMTSVARAIETGRTRGFMKTLVDPKTDQILGAAILGDQGGEIMSLLEVAMMGKLKYTALRDAIFAHPTLAESMNNLFFKFEDN